MESNTFVLAYYLGLLVFVGNFLIMWRAVKTQAEVKIIEKRIVSLLRLRKRRR